ncbi:MAG: phosphatidylglycerol:prolipoprotein diacylglycerol transferase [Candidatus Peregrinibacteria bacterium Greene1014_49]|nr:MAG: phosphatidylglycerol:prolipoprotein diacylglycerol transferase [Candidatus Peregrinibacteria bacterium Greene1014_49]
MHFFPSRSVALSILSFDVHWYGLLYLAGFILGYVLAPRLQRYRNIALSEDAWSDILTWTVLGVLIGGRLGYVFLYDPVYFLHHPLEILMVWHGGMASHGGFIGVILALVFMARKHKIPLFALGDIVVVPVAIGLALGRLGNFINQELYGAVTTLPWAIAIPGVEGLRHPTQLYAVGKDLFIALVCYLHLRLPGRPKGQTAGIFLVLYGVLRFFIEFLRVPTHSSIVLGTLMLTRGQGYSVPIVVGGIGVLLWGWRRGRSDS